MLDCTQTPLSHSIETLWRNIHTDLWWCTGISWCRGGEPTQPFWRCDPKRWQTTLLPLARLICKWEETNQNLNVIVKCFIFLIMSTLLKRKYESQSCIPSFSHLSSVIVTLCLLPCLIVFVLCLCQVTSSKHFIVVSRLLSPCMCSHSSGNSVTIQILVSVSEISKRNK